VDEITLSARVSKGTYIRSLARDLAYALGSVGHVTMLRRVKAGPFTLEPAISLDKLSELAKARQLEQALLPLTAGLDDIPALSVTPDQARALREGRRLAGIAAKPGLHLATEGSVPVALVELVGGELRPELRVVRGFNL
jgi:tRNA pseudouridine55 synthase